MADWIDTHCHLDFLDAEAGPVLDRARAAGVNSVLTIGTDLQSSEKAALLASELDGVYAAVGIHPHDATQLDDSALLQLREMASVERVVAIGECGLDYFRDRSPRDAQIDAFIKQIELSKELDLTLVIHMRDAHQDVFSLLARFGPPDRVVFHCFSGGRPEAERALELGAYVSFAGNVSFPSAQDLRQAAEATPLDRMLVETDSPFLTPVPHRGKSNEPAYVTYVGAALAGILDISPDEVALATTTNARRLFRL